MPLSYCCIGSNLAEFRITAPLQQRGYFSDPRSIRRNKLIAAKQSTSIVLANDIAVADMHVLRTIDVKSVVVQIDAIVNSDAVEYQVLALKQPHTVIGTRSQEHIAH